jgi:hypothetical protein
VADAGEAAERRALESSTLSNKPRILFIFMPPLPVAQNRFTQIIIIEKQLFPALPEDSQKTTNFAGSPGGFTQFSCC